MSTPLTNCKGIGPKTEELFRKMGVTCQEELLRFYPRDYDVYAETISPEEAMPGQLVSVLARVPQRPSVKRFGKQSITMLFLGKSRLQVNWFHMPYLRTTLRVGEDYVFRGRVIEKNGRRILQHPELFSPEEYKALSGRLLPIYALTAGLSNRTVRKTVRTVLENGLSLPDALPESIRQDKGLCDLDEALRLIHYPQDVASMMRARKRLVFEEFFVFQLEVAALRQRMHLEKNGFPMPRTEKTNLLRNSLPYTLTQAQQDVHANISEDLSGPYLMHRLLQGDVGSGKTIVAFLAMMQAFENGWQSAIMAPTEVLATQHYQSLCSLLDNAGFRDVCPVLRTGSLTAAEKRSVDEMIASGKARMIVGTHALFQEAVQYPELGLVVTDEQHRFGVRQRAALQGKGKTPHVLVMSATPIPRTLARILYSDLDVSLLKEMPKNRLRIKNAVVDTSYRETALRFIAKEVRDGHQAFIICPMIEPNEDLPCENVTDYHAMLQKKAGDTMRVGKLHGQMPAQDKETIMKDFADGKIDVLVSTTVIEVGIDVPNATVMLIENAERFGLAQLHQLRGRVGRGEAQSYCIFVQGNGKKEKEPRLEILGRSNDGFEIAEEDLALRGPGDLFGTRQSGLQLFRIGDIYRDRMILEEANEAASAILKEDPTLALPIHDTLKKECQKLAYYTEKDYDM